MNFGVVEHPEFDPRVEAGAASGDSRQVLTTNDTSDSLVFKLVLRQLNDAQVGMAVNFLHAARSSWVFSDAADQERMLNPHVTFCWAEDITGRRVV